MSAKEDEDNDKRRVKGKEKLRERNDIFLERTTRSKPEETFRNKRLLAHAGAFIHGFLLQFPDFLLRFPALGGMPVAEAVHPDGFDAEAGAVLVRVAGTGGIAGAFFTLAPFVYGEGLMTHGGIEYRVRSIGYGGMEERYSTEECGVDIISVNFRCFQ